MSGLAAPAAATKSDAAAKTDAVAKTDATKGPDLAPVAETAAAKSDAAAPATEAAAAGTGGRKLVELSARLAMRVPECSLECGKLPPGLGLAGSIGMRLHEHVAVGFLVGHERFFYSEDTYPLVGYTKIGVFARGYWLARGPLDPYAEVGGIAGKFVGECPGGGETGGGFGYRFANGLDVYLGPSLKLGFALSYERIRMECLVSSNGVVPLAPGSKQFDPPATAGGLGIETAITALAF